MNVTTMPKAPPPAELFILDTNVLVDFAWGKAGFKPGEKNYGPGVRKAVSWLFKTQHVVVPHITIIEFAGKFFQERIGIVDYPNWHRQRTAAFMPLIRAIFDPATHVHLHSAPTRVEALNHAMQPLPAPVINAIKAAYDSKRPEYRSQRDPKALDGVDAQILDEATVVAMSSPSTYCWLVTSDRGLKAVVEDVRRRAATDERWPRNLYPMSGVELVRRHQERNLQGGL
jgi:hypothetical protein